MDPTPEAAILAILAERRSEAPLLVGLAGAVGVGKSTVAHALAELARGRGDVVVIVSTDNFLLPNAELASTGRLMRKGFPDTYDTELLTASMVELVGGRPARIPVYSHVVYDRVPDAIEAVGPGALVIVEGVNALQPAVADCLHLGVYLDAPEPLVRGWFVDRFLRLCEEAEAHAASFYRMFVDLDDEGRRAVAEQTWDGINGVNLRDHILPTRDRADVVIEKGADHAVRDVRRQPPSAPSLS